MLSTDFEMPQEFVKQSSRKADRGKLARNARARRILERRFDRQVLRKHVEEVWN